MWESSLGLVAQSTFQRRHAQCMVGPRLHTQQREDTMHCGAHSSRMKAFVQCTPVSVQRCKTNGVVRDKNIQVASSVRDSQNPRNICNLLWFWRLREVFGNVELKEWQALACIPSIFQCKELSSWLWSRPACVTLKACAIVSLLRAAQNEPIIFESFGGIEQGGMTLYPVFVRKLMRN